MGWWGPIPTQLRADPDEAAEPAAFMTSRLQDTNSQPGVPSWGPLLDAGKARVHDECINRRYPRSAVEWDERHFARKRAWDESPFAAAVDRLRP